MNTKVDIGKEADIPTSGAYSRAPLVLFVAALLLLLGDAMQLWSTGIAWTIVLAIAFVFFAFGLLCLPVAIGVPKDRLISAGAICAFVGSIAGAAMQVLFRAWTVLEAATQTEAVKILQAHSGVTFSTLVPGVLFPLGNLILAMALFRARRLGVIASCTLALGALLFPIGHAIGLPVALLGGDAVLTAAFALILRTHRRYRL